MRELMKKGMPHLLVVAIIILAPLRLSASDVIDITPVTNKILLIVFDDGTVNYPNDLQVDRLAIADAMNTASYTLSSTDDADYSGGLNPMDIGRKSKGTEFVKDPPWGGNSYDPTSKPWASKHFIYLFLDKELKSGVTYTLNTADLAANGTEWTFTFDEVSIRSESVHVNTLGYETHAPKYGYVYQWMGDKGGLDLTDYAGSPFHIYQVSACTKADDPDLVFSGTLKKRKSATNAETGQPNDTPDRNFLGAEVYECDFTSITQEGHYILVVENMGCSYPFKIGSDPVWRAYYSAGRALYYQRSGIRLEPPYTDSGYVRPVNQNTKVTSDDGTDFSGKLLYSDYPYTSWEQGDGGGSSQADIRAAAEGNPLDVAGWYHDAGDWDAYYSHQRIPIMLMLTYEFFPQRFADGDLNIPESGNGIPDLVDEASWLIKFNYRVRKELMDKGYSDGGVGGARVCPDVYNSVEGNAQSDKPSWQDYRHYVLTQADAFMTYLYAGQAAQLALILKNLGKDPHAFPVEMLDHVDFDQMTYDAVDWEKEAREAYDWAVAEVASFGQTYPSNNYGGPVEIYQMYAATSLYRLTDEQEYHDAATGVLEGLRNATTIDEDERYGVYSYLLADNYSRDRVLQTDLVDVAKGNASFRGTESADKRACRWGGVFDMPMLIGQATTPRVVECMLGYGVTGDMKYKDVVHTTADYFLGNNPLHTTWMTHVGPRPAEAGFHLDSRYNNNWVLYPGFIPYGPWSMAYGYDPVTWTIDGVEYEGGKGPWNKDWANFSQYPFMEEWPGHERWNSNIHAPMSAENTVHQNTVNGFMIYGFVNGRENENSTSGKAVSTITLNKNSIQLDAVGAVDTLEVALDTDVATFPALKWESSDSRIAHVDRMGRITGVTAGSCVITVSTLDGSVTATCSVTCSWDEVAVDSISVEPDSLKLVEGQQGLLEVFFSPVDVTNLFVDWSYTAEGIVEVDENGILTTLGPGEVAVIATSLNGSKKDTCFVTVEEATDYMIADFDQVIPVTTTIQPDVPQLYTPGGSADIAMPNPLRSPANNSDKVVAYNKPAGDYKLIGIALPTEQLQPLDRYSQFQFKYFGKGIEEFYIQVKNAENDENYEINATVEGEDAWQLFAYDLEVDFTLTQFNVFVNPRGDMPAMTCFFDDFQLTAEPAVYDDGLSLSDSYLDMASGDEYVLLAENEGYPYTWISTDTSVVQVDQSGKVTAKARGSAEVKVIPLYGDARVCLVDVDGGVYEEPDTYETTMILDFEAYELDWSQGYGAYAWATADWERIDNPETAMINGSGKVFSWDRGATFGGGFGIGFPAVSTGDWSRLSMMVFADAPVGAVQFEFYNGEDLLETYQAEIDVPANKWTQLLFDLSEMGVVNESITSINFMFGVGTDEVYKVWLDNVWLERGTKIPATGVYLNRDETIAMEPGDTWQLEAVVSPVNCTSPGLTWNSSASPVASVTQNGLVTAGAAGMATISVRVTDSPTRNDAVQVEVSSPFVSVESVMIQGDSLLSLQVDSTIQLAADVLPDDATQQAVNWSSDNPAIATVSASGVVTGTGAGSAVILATSADNSEISDQVVVNVTTTDVVDVTGNDFSLYPNPSSGSLTIDAATPMKEISIMDVRGEKLWTNELFGEKRITIDNLSLPGGVYIVHVRMKNGEVYTGRIVNVD